MSDLDVWKIITLCWTANYSMECLINVGGGAGGLSRIFVNTILPTGKENTLFFHLKGKGVSMANYSSFWVTPKTWQNLYLCLTFTDAFIWKITWKWAHVSCVPLYGLCTCVVVSQHIFLVSLPTAYPAANRTAVGSVWRPDQLQHGTRYGVPILTSSNSFTPNVKINAQDFVIILWVSNQKATCTTHLTTVYKQVPITLWNFSRVGGQIFSHSNQYQVVKLHDCAQQVSLDLSGRWWRTPYYSNNRLRLTLRWTRALRPIPCQQLRQAWEPVLLPLVLPTRAQWAWECKLGCLGSRPWVRTLQRIVH